MAEQQPQPQPPNDEFPYKLTLTLPFPTAHLAETASRALAVDLELSPLVRRTFSAPPSASADSAHELKVEYAATTNRMLRVAVNGFLESVGVVVGVMRELDVDVYEREGVEGEGGLSGVQGLVGVGVGVGGKG
ncbi:Pcc1-domain-containing protein [Melanomma pulvis-pyrius CBS 109.77]|uniref:Pcc1-domain-containing protein n=1 Tax=Melanomma pulvis-pyrius CBS 109.77 TaxID=1314802 RepID=A0A6A6XP33_9PLEO|nr:Pcc1-domain-containing protein [Melanomma pulvis-pyrius CBS 109.77]